MEKTALLTQNLLLLQKIHFAVNGTVKYAWNAQIEHILIKKETVKELAIIAILGIREVEIV